MNHNCHSRYSSFRFAFAGLKRLVKEHNFRIHLLIATMTTVAGLLCRLSLIEWSLIIICFGMVMAAEGLNTAIEILADRVCPDRDESIRLAKDVSAGAVLLAAIATAIVGTLIFATRIISVASHI